MQTPDKRRLGVFLLGGLVGAVAGILFAPRSGRETRGSITDRAEEARERSREAYFDAQERMRERLARRREASDHHPVEEENVGAAPSEMTPDHERLREKIRETRARLRARLGEDEDDGGSG